MFVKENPDRKKIYINFYKALKAGAITSKFNLKQLIHEPTHVTANYPPVFT